MSRDEQDVYEEHVLPHFEQPYHRGELATATHRSRVDNPVCGDVVQIFLRISDRGVVEEVWQTGAGCIISQAAASMLAGHVEGLPVDRVEKFSADDMLTLFGARLTPRRQHCCLLSLRALRQALGFCTKI